MEARCRIELLGGLRVVQGERVITRFMTYKTGVLLAYLAFYRLRAHPREQLIEMLWPDCEPEAGRNSLSKALSSLRHQLEPPGIPAGAVLRADRASVQLNPDSTTTDVWAFETALQAAAKARTEAMDRLAEAVELYHGELLPGYYEDWNLREHARLTDSYMQALHTLIAHLETKGALNRALDYARRAVNADPLREESHAALIRLYLAAGEPVAARRQYGELERLLQKELGVTPDPVTRALIERQARTTKAARALPSPTDATRIEPSPPVIAPSPSLPGGTVTFLLLEREDSPEEEEPFLLIFLRHGGQEIQRVPEKRLVAFGRAGDALAAAVELQRTLADARSAKTAAQPPPRRIALHTVEIRNPAETPSRSSLLPEIVLDHAAHLHLAAHAGQILCSEVTAVLLRSDLDPGLKLIDLGVYRLRGEDNLTRLFTVDFPGSSLKVAPPPNAEPGHSGNLPMQFTRFFGRVEEIARICGMLVPAMAGATGQEIENSSDIVPSRLITVTGPGGTGKTRTALEAARQLLEPFRGAVWFVPLADLSDPRHIVAAMMDALRLTRSPNTEPLLQVIETLSRQSTLLVLDNFEQLLTEESDAHQGPHLVRTLMEQAPSLCCLVTSRRPLGLAGEREMALAPLPAPQSAGTPEQLSLYESVQLFVDRAQAVRPDFQVTPGNAAALAALCARLEGIPLALELAAARSQVLTPAQMLLQLDHRFDFLVSRRRDIAPRHRTMRAAVDWSYQTLAPALQRLFAGLSVFRGGWSLEAAEQVTGDRELGIGERQEGAARESGAKQAEETVFPVTSNLSPVTSHEVLDYLAQLRECSLILPEEDSGGSIRFRFLETLREFAQERLTTTELDLLRHRHADYFLAQAEAADPALAGPEQAEWLSRLETEHENMRAALRWCTESGEAEMGLRLCSALRRFWLVRGYWSEGREQLATALAQAVGPVRPEVRANALDCAGLLAYRQGDHAAGRAFYEESLALRRKIADPRGIALALHNLGNVTHGQGDSATAHSLYEESLEIRRAMDDKPGIAPLLNNLGLIALERADYVTARRLNEESLALRRELGDKRGIALSLFNLVLIAWHQGDAASAHSLLEESLAIHRELKDKQGIASVLSRRGHLLLHEGDYAAARSALQECLALRRDLGDRIGIAALMHALGNVAMGEGDHAAARAHYVEGLLLSRDTGDRWRLADCLEGFAGLALAQEQPERAARLFGMDEAVRHSLDVALNPFDRPYYERNLAAAQAALGEEAFAKTWAEGRAMTQEQTLAYALEMSEGAAPARKSSK